MSLNVLVVIPAFNEQHFVDGCIGAIRRHLNETKLSFDIVVVDNGSTDSTALQAQRLETKVISIARASVSRARNTGAKFQSSQFIAFVDADVLVTEEWAQALERLVSVPHTQPILTGCQCSVRDNGGVMEKHWFQNLKDRHLGGGNIIASREAFEQIGGFDESFRTGEDYDFCIRAQNKNIDYRFDEGFKTIHLGYPRDVRNFVKRELWHGAGNFRSLETFLASPVAMVAVAYLAATIVLASLLLMGQSGLFVLALSILLVGNFALTAIRFRGSPFRTLLINSVINYVYFLARGLSFVKALANRRNLY